MYIYILGYAKNRAETEPEHTALACRHLQELSELVSMLVLCWGAHGLHL